MAKKRETLTVAAHQDQSSFYEGGHYELNMSFEMLRDKQWQRILEALWQHPMLHGPLDGRYYPGGPTPPASTIQAPPPTATLVQHGQMRIGNLIIGIDVQATRSLFECVSALIPVNMLAGLKAEPQMRQRHPELAELDSLLCDIALRVYDMVPFKIAAMGFERECQLPIELRRDNQQREAFLATGNFFAQDDVLSALEQDLSVYEQVRANLYWLGPGQAS
jgi:hypothetical protein